MRKVLLLLVLLVVVTIVSAYLGGAKPAIELPRPVKAIGASTPIGVRVSSEKGVRRFDGRIEQGGRSFSLITFHTVQSRWKFWRKSQPVRDFQLVAGRKVNPELRDGPARLVFEAQSDDFRGATTTMAVDLQVRSEPPALTADGFQHYINQGGAEMVVFTAGPETTESGVRVGSYVFRSWPLPGGPSGSRFAIFAYPYDVSPETAPIVYARDEAGNERTAAFWFRVFPKKFRTRDFELTDDFLQKVTQEIKPHAPRIAFTGDPLANYLKINRDLRLLSNRILTDLRFETEPRFLWSQPFRQLADSQVEAQFADHRRYLYKGSKVDQQDHLGFDLAKTANASIVASNDGKVVYADYLGIYGNCIVIDHGYALQSIYGHLSSIGVKTGEVVKQGQEIGRSGATGLAGGDHLHFSMQIDGVQVNPTEWWDPHWIHDRVLLELPGKALAPAAAAAGGAAAGDGSSAALSRRRARRAGHHARGAGRSRAH